MQSSFIIEPNSKNSIYTIKSKNDLKKKSMQNVLKKYHLKKNEIRCNCNLDKELYLQVKNIGNSFYLAKYPKSQEHNSDCIFHSFANEFINQNEDGVSYKASIFDETKPNTNENQESRDRENARSNTYYSFCHDLIAEANINAFFIANKKQKNLVNYNFEQFCQAYFNALRNSKIVSHNNAYDYFKGNKEFKFEYGIINSDIVGNLDLIKKDDKDEVSIDVNPIFYNVNDSSYELNTKTSRILFKRLRIAKNLVVNFSNIIAVPYFYNAVYKNGIIVRLHITPIYFENNNICFIESSYERNFVHKLFEKDVPFLRPISNDEIDSIYPYKLGLPESLYKIPHIIYNADFLLFEDNYINIIEVSGYSFSDYKELLNKKANYYQYLCNTYAFFKYSIYDGLTGKLLRDNGRDFWDGEELITNGKYKGKVWKQLEKKTLLYYVEKFKGDVFTKALKELQRRKDFHALLKVI